MLSATEATLLLEELQRRGERERLAWHPLPGPQTDALTSKVKVRLVQVDADGVAPMARGHGQRGP